VTQEDEAGDWTVFDHYEIGKTGELGRDRREIRILPGDRLVEETYSIRDGVVDKQSTNTKSLSTGQKLTDGEDWLPDVPVLGRMKDFRFAPLMALEHSQVVAKGKICTPSKEPSVSE